MENKNTDFVTLTTSDLEDQSENVFTTFIVNPWKKALHWNFLIWVHLGQQR